MFAKNVCHFCDDADIRVIKAWKFYAREPPRTLTSTTFQLSDSSSLFDLAKEGKGAGKG